MLAAAVFAIFRQVAWTKHNAHEWPVNTLYNVSEGVLASGDDQGVVKVSFSTSYGGDKSDCRRPIRIVLLSALQQERLHGIQRRSSREE